jgi:hypothetical protein
VWTRSSCASRIIGARIKPAFIDLSSTGILELRCHQASYLWRFHLRHFLALFIPFLFDLLDAQSESDETLISLLSFFCGAMIPCIWRVAGGVPGVGFYSLDANMNLQIILSRSKVYISFPTFLTSNSKLFP